MRRKRLVKKYCNTCQGTGTTIWDFEQEKCSICEGKGYWLKSTIADSGWGR